MTFNVIIPARYGSTRLPRKMLAPITGKPMIKHVIGRACASGANEVWVATDHDEIRAVVATTDAKVIMTREDHTSGTSRLAEVVTTLGWDDNTIVVNLQGDEPLIAPDNIAQVAGLLSRNPQANMASLYEKFAPGADVANPNMVKVVVDEQQRALYFSRSPIPYIRDAGIASTYEYLKHIGLYAYRVGFLKKFASWPTTELAKLESLEQLTVLARGEPIYMAQALKFGSVGVDTAEDLAVVESLCVG